MKSKIYFGRVQHNRLKPKKNSFQYGIFMMYIDLDELPTMFDRFLLWSKDKINFASFKTKNYLVDKNLNIKNGVRNEIKKQTGILHNGPVRMLTHLSYFGYCFNPVTFYYCFDQSDEKVEFIVAQINNTPWDERYCYVIENRNNSEISKYDQSDLQLGEQSNKLKQTERNKNKTKTVESLFDKKFHVSPFLPMNMQYFWRFTQPDKKLSVYMKNTQDKDKIFDVTLTLKSRPINSANLAKALIQYPFMTWQVIYKIYWQSLILWLKKIDFYDNPRTSKKVN